MHTHESFVLKRPAGCDGTLDGTFGLSFQGETKGTRACRENPHSSMHRITAVRGVFSIALACRDYCPPSEYFFYRDGGLCRVPALIPPSVRKRGILKTARSDDLFLSCLVCFLDARACFTLPPPTPPAVACLFTTRASKGGRRRGCTPALTCPPPTTRATRPSSSPTYQEIPTAW